MEVFNYLFYRCASAPAIPPEVDHLEQEPSSWPSRKAVLKSYTLDGPMMDDHTGTSVSKPSKAKARVSYFTPPQICS